MKSLNAEAQAHILSRSTTLAMCWKLIRPDGTILGFTDYHEPLDIGGVTYEAQVGMINATATTHTSELSVPALDIEAVLDSTTIKREDLLAGRFDYAELFIFLVDYTDPGAFEIRLMRGRLGEISITALGARAEARGMTSLLKQRIGRTHEATCAYELGDTDCGVDLETFGVDATVSATTSRSHLVLGTGDDGYYTHGKIKFVTGANEGLTMEIKSNAAGEFVTALPMPFDIGVGDQVRIYPGCNKRWATCRDKFSNAMFSGFPHIPGSDAVYSSGDVSP